jgi:molybdopterin/thiamine biosynthesis adenylyltransferase
MTDALRRYHRQMLLPFIGEDGQRKLRASRAAVIGCGALGGYAADLLARAGIGGLTLVDRDVVELSNLQRQTLYEEADVAEGTPKAEAAKRRLNRINRDVDIRAVVGACDARSAMACIEDADIIIDGLDNFETRYLLNDLAVREHLPFIHGGAVAMIGSSMIILPHPRRARADRAGMSVWGEAGATACLRCVFPEPPPAGAAPTCDTVGVLGPAVSIIASWQATQAIKLLTGNLYLLDRSLMSLDLMANELRRITPPPPGDDCPCCGRGDFQFLDETLTGRTTTLCGRDTIQVSPPTPAPGGAPSKRGHSGRDRLDLEALASRLRAHGGFEMNRFLVRGVLDDERDADGAAIGLTVFPDGRALVHGAVDETRARIIYDRYVGG